MPDTITLHCALGDHDWQREVVRGARPTSCPDCKAAAAAEQQAKPEVPADNKVTRMMDLALDAYDRLPDETRRAVDWLYNELSERPDEYHADTLWQHIRKYV